MRNIEERKTEIWDGHGEGRWSKEKDRRNMEEI
jgi:hypothetical protein